MPLAVVLGEALIDLLEQPGGDLRPAVGGAPLNVAVCLARLGTPARLATAVGTDAFGDRLLEFAASSGVDVSGCERVPGPTPLAVATFAAAEPQFSFYGDPPAYARLSAADVPPESVLYCGSIALLSTPFVDVARAAWRTEGVVRVLDPNLRPFLLGTERERADCRALIEEFAATADLVKLSDADAELLYGRTSPSAAALRLRALGARNVVVTLGEGGAILARPDRGSRPSAMAAHAIHPSDRVFGLPISPGPVSDTTGCGDSVTGALMHALAAGLADDDDAWIDALRYALRVAAWVAQRPGGATAMPFASDL
ncbi:carbohydrate kinase family protein [Hamadaea tsunoensis]|uniref:carbohydrate kinase family protein n=1 Tax=Hamadaea tsunoensis TaxID=53368 RepID=UPI0003F59581|nr:carbohydrate kinase [Hamadaea tsunoensis]